MLFITEKNGVLKLQVLYIKLFPKKCGNTYIAKIVCKKLFLFQVKVNKERVLLKLLIKSVM